MPPVFVFLGKETKVTFLSKGNEGVLLRDQEYQKEVSLCQEESGRLRSPEVRSRCPVTKRRVQRWLRHPEPSFLVTQKYTRVSFVRKRNILDKRKKPSGKPDGFLFFSISEIQRCFYNIKSIDGYRRERNADEQPFQAIF